MLAGEQIRAARAMLRIEQTELAKLAGVSVPTVTRLEGMNGLVTATTRTVQAIAQALEAAGVIFLPADAAAGPGVRLRHPQT